MNRGVGKTVQLDPRIRGHADGSRGLGRAGDVDSAIERDQMEGEDKPEGKAAALQILQHGHYWIQRHRESEKQPSASNVQMSQSLLPVRRITTLLRIGEIKRRQK